MSYWWALGISAAIFAVTLSLHLSWHRGVHPRPWIVVARYLHVHVFIAVACGVLAGVLAGALGYKGYQVLYGPHGVIQPPAPAQRPPRGAQHSGPQRGRGLLPPHGRIRPPHFFGAGTQQYTDLSAYMPPVQNQGAVQSCASWATAYALRGYYANRARAYPSGGYAPYYIYSQLTGGANTGTSLDANFALIGQQGVDNQADYYQQIAGNYWNPPTPGERAHAMQWRSLGFQTLFQGAGQGVLVEQAIRQSLVNGDPVVVGIPIYSNTFFATKNSYYITGIQGGYYGLHATVAAKSDANGVWLFGSWGTEYGLNGWIEVSYAFLDRYAEEAAIMIMPHPAPPAPTPPPAPPARPHLFLLLHDQHPRPLPAYWPAERAILKKGILLKGTGQQKGVWLRLFIPHGRAWFLKSNLRKVQ